MSKTNRADIVSAEKKFMPSPGNYDDGREFGKGVKGFKMSGKGEEKVRNANPGPGAYDEKTDYVKERVRSVNMSKAQVR